jgi:hypothetical protein
MATHPDLVADITAAIDEDMRVCEGASDDVRRTRGRCRALEGRLRALLKALPGEVSEQVLQSSCWPTVTTSLCILLLLLSKFLGLGCWHYKLCCHVEWK